MGLEIAGVYCKDLSCRTSALEARKSKHSVARTSSNTMLVATGRRASRGAARCSIRVKTHSLELPVANPYSAPEGAF